MVPLLIASGPGAVSRFHIGLVIASGLGIGTLFTLFVVPAVYLLLARKHGGKQAVQEPVDPKSGLIVSERTDTILDKR
jgi:multidrug efflux pump